MTWPFMITLIIKAHSRESYQLLLMSLGAFNWHTYWSEIWPTFYFIHWNIFSLTSQNYLSIYSQIIRFSEKQLFQGFLWSTNVFWGTMRNWTFPWTNGWPILFEKCGRVCFRCRCFLGNPVGVQIQRIIITVKGLLLYLFTIRKLMKVKNSG